MVFDREFRECIREADTNMLAEFDELDATGQLPGWWASSRWTRVKFDKFLMAFRLSVRRDEKVTVDPTERAALARGRALPPFQGGCTTLRPPNLYPIPQPQMHEADAVSTSETETPRRTLGRGLGNGMPPLGFISPWTRPRAPARALGTNGGDVDEDAVSASEAAAARGLDKLCQGGRWAPVRRVTAGRARQART